MPGTLRAGVLAVLALASAAPAQAATGFAIRGFSVAGDNPLGEASTRSLLGAFARDDGSLAAVQAAAQALERALVEAGYSFHRVVVPPHRIENGIVRLEVLAFRVDQVEVTGNQHFGADNVRRALPALAPGATLNARALARAVDMANEHPARHLTVVMRESATPDHLDANVVVNDAPPLNAYAHLANSGQATTGRNRLTVGFSHGNLFDRDHQVSASYTTSPGHAGQARQWGLRYHLPLYAEATSIGAYFVRSDVDTGTVAEFFDVSGSGRFAGVEVQHRLLKRGRYAHAVSLGLEQRLFESNVSFAGIPIGSDVATRPLTLAYSGRWRGDGAAAGGRLAWVHNLPGGRSNDAPAYAASRAGARRDWDALRMSLDVERTLPGQWRLNLNTEAQYAHEPLVSGEQFGLGGAGSVRGFQEREEAGDRGLRMSLEAWTPPLDEHIRALAFVDLGRRWLERPQLGETRTETLSSLGLGLRWQIESRLGATLDLARVLDGATTTRSGDFGLHFTLLYRI